MVLEAALLQVMLSEQLRIDDVAADCLSFNVIRKIIRLSGMMLRHG